MRKIVFAISFILASLNSVGQTNLDSLYADWQDETQDDSTRTEVYVSYIWYGFLFSYPDSAFLLAEALHGYANKHNYPKASAEGYNVQGIANHVQSNYAGALACYKKSLAIQKEIGHKSGIASSLTNIGTGYLDQGNPLRALEYYEQSLVIQEEIGHKSGMASSLNNIGSIYQLQGNYTRALEYNQKSLTMEEEIGDKSGIATSLNNIGLVYEQRGNYERALEYFNKSMVLLEEIGDSGGIARSLSSMGGIYTAQGDYSRASEHYMNGLVILEKIGDREYTSTTLNSIGNLYLQQGKASLALNYCQRGLAIAEEIESLVSQKQACQCLYETYKTMGKGNEALVYMEKIRAVEDSLNTEETAKKLQQMEFAKQMLADSLANAEQSRLVEEAHQEEVHQKNKTRNALIGGGLFLFLIAGGIYSRLRYVRKSKATLQEEKDRSEDLLLNILPQEIAEELKEKGRADARDFEMVTILFTDFIGFTAASEKLSAQDLVSEINTCFVAFDGIMAKYNIEKIKTIGDAYMAAGGLPVPTNDSVKNSVLAALEMQAFISKRKAEMDDARKPAFEMRVGIHTGPVVAGIVGVKKFQYDIWGDTVNTASRMESSGEVGKVNISQATYVLLRKDPQFAFENRGRIEAKGKGEIEMYFVSNA